MPKKNISAKLSKKGAKKNFKQIPENMSKKMSKKISEKNVRTNFLQTYGGTKSLFGGIHKENNYGKHDQIDQKNGVFFGANLQKIFFF